MTNHKMYKLFANCVLCKGIERAVIYDLQRNQYHLIPLSLFHLFDEHGILEIDHSDFSEDEMKIIKEYLVFLLEHVLIFSIDEDELDLFPRLNNRWQFPSVATNVIIDLGNCIINWDNIVEQLEKLKCYCVQIRSFETVSFEVLEQIGSLISPSLIHAFEILIPYEEQIIARALEKNYANKNPKMRCIIFHGATHDEEIKTPDNGFGTIQVIASQITDVTHCGIVNSSYFSLNIETYTESLAHNSCLNRKVAIDVDGNIKNCPSMKEHFGNISETTLEEAINKPGFRKYWNITKDEISKCKDCEFRYVCTDAERIVKTLRMNIQHLLNVVTIHTLARGKSGATIL